MLLDDLYLKLAAQLISSFRLSRRVEKYLLALVGPVGSAIAQFGLSLVLLRRLSPDDFGSLSFLLVTSQFSWAIWSALFCAPLPVLLAPLAGVARDRICVTMRLANYLGAALLLVAFFALANSLSIGVGASLLFGFYAVSSLLRWYARAEAYALDEQAKAVRSDLMYSASLVVGVAALAVTGAGSLQLAFGMLSLSIACGMVPFAYGAGRRVPESTWKMLAAYKAVWLKHSRWSLLGVVTTEATANAHAYLVTLLQGPAAFAPVAASALLIRPIQVALNALSEYERAQMARDHANGSLNGNLNIFRTVVMAGWLGMVVLSFLLLTQWPRLVFPEKYDLYVVTFAVWMWQAVALIRVIRTPETVLLQAVGQFRLLALASVFSAVMSITAVAALVVLRGPIWSIGGILAGELAFAVAVWRNHSAWRYGAKQL